jgi:hypothetical protein
MLWLICVVRLRQRPSPARAETRLKDANKRGRQGWAGLGRDGGSADAIGRDPSPYGEGAAINIVVNIGSLLDFLPLLHANHKNDVVGF